MRFQGFKSYILSVISLLGEKFIFSASNFKFLFIFMLSISKISRTIWTHFHPVCLKYERMISYSNRSLEIGHSILGQNNASVNSKHQHPLPPAGASPGFCTLLLPRGQDLYLMTFPGAGFLHIHKIMFSTVKKYTFTQLALGSYLHALHRQFRLSILA